MSDIQPKVSIVIPVHNCEPYIEKCIISVIEQSYKNIEVIIIDDGSTDKSGEILDMYSEDRVFIIHQNNAGVCVARNKGISRATGEYITFIDGDDYIDSDYIEQMVVTAEENESELVISGFLIENIKGKKKKVLVPPSNSLVNDEMWAYRLSSACGRLYSKEFWDKNNISFTLQEGVRGEDVPICLFANYAAENIVLMDYAGYHYVQHKGSATHEYVGLKKFGFPYEAMDELAKKVNTIDKHNSREFYEVGILKLFAQFYFFMGRGADIKIKQDMLNRFKTYLSDNCPNYKTSWKYVRRSSKMPLTIRGAIEAFTILIAI